MIAYGIATGQYDGMHVAEIATHIAVQVIFWSLFKKYVAGPGATGGSGSGGGTGNTISDDTLKWLNKGDADNVVYYGMKDGEAVYTGITKQELAKRLYQHNYGSKGKGLDYLEQLLSGLTRNQARAIEQCLIENGSANSMNQINSISPNSSYYNEALHWAENFLNGL